MLVRVSRQRGKEGNQRLLRNVRFFFRYEAIVFFFFFFERAPRYLAGFCNYQEEREMKFVGPRGFLYLD